MSEDAPTANEIIEDRFKTGSKFAYPGTANMDITWNDLATIKEYITRLEAIVDKLPKTADGVPVVPGEYVWTPGLAMWIVCRGNGSSDYCETLAAEPNAYDMDPSAPVKSCYSTREAAEAAASD